MVRSKSVWLLICFAITLSPSVWAAAKLKPTAEVLATLDAALNVDYWGDMQGSLDYIQGIYDTFEIDPQTLSFRAKNGKSHRFLKTLGADVEHPLNLIRYWLEGNYVSLGGWHAFSEFIISSSAVARAQDYKLSAQDVASICKEFAKVDCALAKSLIGEHPLDFLVKLRVNDDRELPSLLVRTSDRGLIYEGYLPMDNFSTKKLVEMKSYFAKRKSPVTLSQGDPGVPNSAPLDEKALFISALESPRGNAAIIPYESQDLRKVCSIYRESLFEIYSTEAKSGYDAIFGSFKQRDLDQAKQLLSELTPLVISKDSDFNVRLKIVLDPWTPAVIKPATMTLLTSILSGPTDANASRSVTMFSDAELQDYLSGKSETLGIRVNTTQPIAGDVKIALRRNQSPLIKATVGSQSVISDNGKLTYDPILPAMPGFYQWLTASMKLKPKDYASFANCAKSWGPPAPAIAGDVVKTPVLSATTTSSSTASAHKGE